MTYLTSVDDNADLMDLRLLAWANVDRHRLAEIVTETTGVFPRVKRSGQVAIAKALHQAVWNWVDAYPDEYEILIVSGGKLSGDPDVLFDTLDTLLGPSSSSGVSRDIAFLPLMASLLILCPDSLRKLVGTERPPASLAKKLSFLEGLRKGLLSKASFDACVQCYVDFVRAAGHAHPRLASSGIRKLARDVQNDLKVSSVFVHTSHSL